MQEVRSVVIPSNYPERTGKHFIRCCNRQTPQSGDISIAGAILQHTGNILELSQERLSAEAHLSGASISRFIRRCGFESFQSFKNQFERFLSQRTLRRSKHFLAAYHDQSDMDVGRQLYDDAVQNLKATMDDLPLPLLEQTARMMCQSRTVYLVGDGRDLYCFYSLQLDLLCSGRAAYFYNVDEVSEHTMPPMDSRTLVLLLSVNPFWYHEEIASLCDAARKARACTVLFTQGSPSEDVKANFCCRYGRPGSVNDGYYSLYFLAQLLSVLFYRAQ